MSIKKDLKFPKPNFALKSVPHSLSFNIHIQHNHELMYFYDDKVIAFNNSQLDPFFI